jgi:hypothetical protein
MKGMVTAGLAIAALGITGAAAQTTKYGQEAGWAILVRSDLGPGCMITKSNPDDMTQIQMGIDASAGLKGYMAIYTKKDANIAAGQQLSVVFEVDGEKFTGVAKGQQVGDYVGAFVWVNNPEFIYNLAKKKTLTITSPGRRKLVVNLKGTDAAFDKLRACQNAQ